MNKELITVLHNIKDRVKQVYKDDKKLDVILKKIEMLQDEYKEIKIEEEGNMIAASLVKKGRELLKENNIKDKNKLNYYLRYLGAAVYDFNNNLKPLNKIYASFLVMCICFLVLSPQYFSYILPILFLLPIYLGIKGLKVRKQHGLTLCLSVVPMGILTSIAWMKNTFLGFKDFNSYVDTISELYNLSLGMTKNLVIFFTLLSIVLLVSGINTLRLGIKHKRMFI